MTLRVTFRGSALALAVVACAGGALLAVTEPPPEPVSLGLYDWMATAPVVIAADIVADDSKFVKAITRRAFKGALVVDGAVLVDLRRANRDRELGVPALDLEKGRVYLLLLQASPRGKKEPYPVFDLVRGVRGAKRLPAEGSAATIAAVARLAEVQERNDDAFLWASLPGFLEDENPVLVDAALDLYVKFHRETAALIPVVSPLLEHTRPDVRRRAALVLGRVLKRADSTDVPERRDVIAELSGRARRDDDVSVRRAATAAIAALQDAGIDETLHAIARDDPDQNVRFEAEKAVFERSQNAAQKRSD